MSNEGENPENPVTRSTFHRLQSSYYCVLLSVLLSDQLQLCAAATVVVRAVTAAVSYSCEAASAESRRL